MAEVVRQPGLDALHERPGIRRNGSGHRFSLRPEAGQAQGRFRRERGVGAARGELGVTGRELEVVTLLAGGPANKEITARLYMWPRTVERHIANLTVKAGLGTRSEVIAFAARNASPPA